MNVKVFGWCGLVLCLAAGSLIVSGLPAAGVAGYGDVAGDKYYAKPVQWSVDNNITGLGGTCFKPDAPVSRGETAFYMWNMEGQPVGPAHSFDDVSDSSQDEAISWLFANEITTGTSATTFSPDRTLTRAEIAAFLHRLAGNPAAPAHSFSDVVSGWQQAPVSWLSQSGITTGTSPTTFSPNRTLTRAELITFLYRYQGKPAVTIDPNTPLCDPNAPVIDDTATELSKPGEGVTITMGRATWSTGYFQAQVHKQLLEELGYTVTEPSELELNPWAAYRAMAQGEFDFWANSWYPQHYGWLAIELPDGSQVGDHIEIVGDQMLSGGVSGFVITKSVADEHGITHLDQLNDDPEITALFDIDGNGKADIYGCQESWSCGDIINNQIAFSGWNNIEQITAEYNTMLIAAEAKVNVEEPMVLYTWSPSGQATRFRPGDNVYWLAVEEVLDDSNPTGIHGGETHDQRPGQAPFGPEHCPAAADADTCQIGWTVNDILVTANSDFLDANPAAKALWEAVVLSPHDVSLAISMQVSGSEAEMARLARNWIANNRQIVDPWLTTARAQDTPTTVPSSFTAVTAGGAHSCAIRTDDTIVCWGHNNHGQSDAPSGSFQAIAAGDSHSCGLRSDRTIVCWGNNSDGQTDAPEGSFQTIAAGTLNSCAIRTDDTIVCWGNNDHGQNDAPAGSFKAVTTSGDSLEQKVDHSCGLRTDNTIVCWGNNDHGQHTTPSGTFQAVDAGGLHSCGLRTDDTIVCWGNNASRQNNAPSGTFQAVTVGLYNSCGVTTDGEIVCWGNNFLRGSDSPGGLFETAVMGQVHGCGLRTGTIVCWGNNSSGQADAP